MLKPSELAPGLLVGDDVALGEGLECGAHVVIHGGTTVGSGVTLGEGAVIGKPPRLGPRSSAPREAPTAAALEDGCAVLVGAIVLAGARIGREAIVGDQAHVRERAVIGAGSVIGRGSAIDNDVRIAERVRVQTNCYITAGSELEDDVFVGPGVVTANDNTMARLQAGEGLPAPRLCRACRVGAGAVICPGIVIGEEAYVAAGTVVTADVAARTVVAGVPAKTLRTVPESDLLGESP